MQYEFDLSELGDKHRYIGSASVIGTFLSSHQIERGLSKRKKEVLCVSCLPHITDIDLLLFSLLSAQSAREKYFLDVLSCEKLKLRPKNKCFCVKIMLHLFSQFSLVSLQSHEINCDLPLPVVT